MIKNSFFGLCFAGLAFVALPALSQTADGETPAEETVCDLEAGAAYGLCVAYCEAMDCHLANDGDAATEPHASGTACDRVGTRFTNVTGRDLPCENLVTCPCFDPSNWSFQETGDLWKQFADQLFDAASTSCTDNDNLTRLVEAFAVEEGDLLGAAVDAAASECHAYFGELEDAVDFVVGFEPGEVEACRSLLQGAAAAQGLSCTQ